MKTQGRNPSVLDLLLCNILGIHNRRRQSGTGAVHYCGRCGIVTRDNRRHVLQVADAKPFAKGMRIIFGAKGQEFIGLVERVSYGENKITLTYVVALPKWRSKLAQARAAMQRFVTLAWLREKYGTKKTISD